MWNAFTDLPQWSKKFCLKLKMDVWISLLFVHWKCVWSVRICWHSLLWRGSGREGRMCAEAQGSPDLEEWAGPVYHRDPDSGSSLARPHTGLWPRNQPPLSPEWHLAVIRDIGPCVGKIIQSHSGISQMNLQFDLTLIHIQFMTYNQAVLSVLWTHVISHKWE